MTRKKGNSISTVFKPLCPVCSHLTVQFLLWPGSSKRPAASQMHRAASALFDFDPLVPHHCGSCHCSTCKTSSSWVLPLYVYNQCVIIVHINGIICDISIHEYAPTGHVRVISISLLESFLCAWSLHNSCLQASMKHTVDCYELCLPALL